MEAHELLTNIHRNSDHFSGMRVVLDSKPPITREPLDQYVCVSASHHPFPTARRIVFCAVFRDFMWHCDFSVFGASLEFLFYALRIF